MKLSERRTIAKVVKAAGIAHDMSRADKEKLRRNLTLHLAGLGNPRADTTEVDANHEKGGQR